MTSSKLSVLLEAKGRRKKRRNTFERVTDNRIDFFLSGSKIDTSYRKRLQQQKLTLNLVAVNWNLIFLPFSALRLPA